MSVAVSPYLPTSQSFFGGQQTDLLDALLQSCQKSSSNPPLPGYGRTLQPYFDAEATAVLRDPVSTARSTSQPRGKAKKARGHKGASGSSASSSDEESSRKVNVVKARVNDPANGGKGMPKENKLHYNIIAQANGSPLTGLAWAGPAFGMAPAPNDIPLPSGFLLD